ncbi:MAG: GIY-YIG nuclease family protein [Peptostreptococcaceae bacterium]
MKEIYGIIYKITNKINEKVYIGQTIRNFKNRYNGDNMKSVFHHTHNEYLREEILEYGTINFLLEQNYDVAYSQDELDIKEIYYIDLYDSINLKKGYNKTTGGKKGYKLIEECKGKNHPRSKKIICLNSKKIFENINQACEENNIDSSSIIGSCKGKRKSAGKHPITGEKLRWMYYDEYLKLNKSINHSNSINKKYGLHIGQQYTRKEFFRAVLGEEPKKGDSLKRQRYLIDSKVKYEVEKVARNNIYTPTEFYTDEKIKYISRLS